jgi:hypothetical protein
MSATPMMATSVSPALPMTPPGTRFFPGFRANAGNQARVVGSYKSKKVCAPALCARCTQAVRGTA